MLARLWKQRWSTAALLALWLVFEGWISWSAFCDPENYQGPTYQGHEKYNCVFHGPVAFGVRTFFQWWGHVFDKPDAYVALFTALLFISTVALWRATNSLWEAGENQLTATQRPWVKVDSVVLISDLIFEHGEARVDVLFKISNKGNSPGLRVRANAKIVASNTINLLEEQRSYAAHFRADPAPNEVRPEITSWAGDQIEFPVRIWLSSIEMTRFKPWADRTPFPITLLAVVGCVDYEFNFAPGHHQTGIIYDLHKVSAYPPGQFGPFVPVPGAVMLQDGADIHRNDLRLSLNFVGTGPVD